MSEFSEETYSQQLNNVQLQLEKLEETLTEVRDLARDAIHICIGVDGHNGLRGTLQKLTTDVEHIGKEFSEVSTTVKDHKELKSQLFKFLTASAMILITQFAGAVWYMSEQHSKQENTRADLEKLSAMVELIKVSKTEAKIPSK